MTTPNSVYWFTGLSGSGKTTLSRAVADSLRGRGIPCLIIDGDQLRHGLCSDLDYSQEARFENVRRAGEMARLFSLQGFICLCALISPYAAMRQTLRERLSPMYHEIFVDCPLEECIRRDPKTLYRQAKAGAISNYTGLGAPYEPPAAPDLRVETARMGLEESVAKALDFVERTRARC